MRLIWWITLLAATQAAPPKSGNSRGKIDWSQDCGVSRKIPIASRIVGGQGAPAGDWPWVAAVIYQGRLRCGGTLISDRHVLTNARSVHRFKVASVTVRLGQQPLSETDKETEYAVEEIIIHPDYDMDSGVDDIAILKLAQSVKMSEDVHRICLPPPDQEPEKKMGYIAGWGFTEHQGELSDDLQEIEVPIWANNLCQAALNVTILRSQLCAGRIAGGADSCTGDAGGPLMIATESGKWELAGIVPYESTCGKASNPSVYTRTSFYLNWINEQVTGNKTGDTRNQQKGESSSSKPTKCGLPSVSSSNRKKRLVGGDPAEEGKWPWQAALLDKFGTQICGGVLITNKHILTSATCASRGNATDFQVRLGGYDLINQKFGKSKRFSVAKVHIYEQYKRSGSQIFNDIALLELSTGITFSNDILHICLPQKRLSLDGRTAFVTSWGSTSKTTDFADVVNEIQLPIWNHEECRETYEVWGVDITDDQLCAGDKIGGKDACTADRGGPLVYQQSNGQWAVIGVVSFSKGCADPGIPGVYTRVDNYKDWIKSKALST